MRPIVVLMLFCLCAIPALADGSPLSGWLDIVWGDGRPGSKVAAGPIYRLTVSDGTSVELWIDESVARSVGGILNMNRKWVTVEVETTGSIVAVSGPPPPRRVVAIRLDAPGPAATPDAVTGPQPWVSILCKFADVLEEPRNLAFFQTMHGSSYPGLDHYWREQSYDAVNITGSSASGWFLLPRPRSYYIADNGDGDETASLTRLREDCIGVANPTIDFGSYVGVNMMFNDDLDCCAWGGSQYLTIDGVGKTWRLTWIPPWGFNNIDTLAHEMGHGFGLPHSSGPYGATYDNQWDVMSDGWTNCARSTHATYGCLGNHTISHHKDLLGWIPAGRKFMATGGTQAVTLEQLALPQSSNFLMAVIPIQGSSTHFYTAEVRRHVGYDVKLPGQAVIIHEVFEGGRPAQVVDPDFNFNTGDAGAMWLAGETFNDVFNGISVHVSSATATGFHVTLTSPSPTTTTLTSSANPSVSGTAVTFTATVSNGATGNVDFYDGNTFLATEALTNATATFITPELTAGTHAITAVYGGSPTRISSTSAVLTQAVSAVVSIDNVTVVEGNAGMTNAVFTVALSSSSSFQIRVDYATANGTATGGGTGVANNGAITIPGFGKATPYPSTINVSGLVGTITRVTVKLVGYSHPTPTDVDALLVGPTGQAVVLMSDVGGSPDVVDIDLTLDDQAVNSLFPVAPLITGTYRPTNLGASDNYPAPAPPPGSGYGSLLSAFNGTAPNGPWSLFITDDTGGNGGSLSGGWSLTLLSTGSTGDYFSMPGTMTFYPGTTTQTVAIPVTGDTIFEGDETFFVNLSGAVNAVIGDAQGQATIHDDDDAPSDVVATATGTTTVQVTWTPVSGAASYRVYRSTNGATYSLVGSPLTSPFVDTTAAANTAYLYKVRSFTSAESSDSNVDLATTVVFAPVLTAEVTTIQANHFTQLITAVNAVRTLAGLAGIAFTEPAPSNGIIVRQQHVLDLRTGLHTARSALALSALAFTDANLTAGSTPIKAAHIHELRNGAK